MSNQNMMPVPINWTSWHELVTVMGVIGTITAIAVTYVDADAEKKAINDAQQVERQAPTPASTTKRLNNLTLQVNSIKARMATNDNTSILTSERLRAIESLEQQLAGLSSTLGAHGEKLKALSTTAQELKGSVAEAGKTIAGAKGKSDQTNYKMTEVRTEVKNISTEVKYNENKLNQIVAAIRLGFANNPEIQPLLDLLALDQTEDSRKIVEALGQIQSHYRNNASQDNKPLSDNQPSTEGTRALADPHLTETRPEIRPENIFKSPQAGAAKPVQKSTDAGQFTPDKLPLELIDLAASDDGAPIVSLCKKYRDLISANSCFDFFLQRLPPKLK